MSTRSDLISTRQNSAMSVTRIDDSNGRLQNVYHEAAAALPDRPIDTVKALRPRWIVAGTRTRTSTTTLPASSPKTRQYLDDVDDPENSTARDFFNAMLQRYPNRRLGATTLWAGTSTLYASRDRHGGEVFHDSIAGWFK